MNTLIFFKSRTLDIFYLLPSSLFNFSALFSVASRHFTTPGLELVFYRGPFPLKKLRAFSFPLLPFFDGSLPSFEGFNISYSLLTGTSSTVAFSSSLLIEKPSLIWRDPLFLTSPPPALGFSPKPTSPLNSPLLLL